ncbi:MAG: efflux RND transporter periplasmic adaptor subunit [Planctomycetaceae bacterium]|nr:efflux RND transporter periplasmic adaptor subunit [Planctomycetaceae bacterium]
MGASACIRPHRKNPSGFRKNTPGFRENTPGFRKNTPGYRENTPGFRENTPGFRENTPGFRKNTSGFRENTSGLRKNTPGFRENTSGIRKNTPGLPAMTHRPRQQSVVLVSLTITALLIGLAVGWGGYRRMHPPETPPQEQKPRPAVNLAPVRVAVAETKELASVRPFIGRLIELKKVVLSPEVTGILETLSVEEGDRVVGGETVIAEIDKTWTEIALKQAEAQIGLYSGELDLQNEELRRMERLAPGRIVTESEINRQKIVTEQLARQIVMAELARDEAKERLERSQIVAPFDGFVVRKSAETGQRVTSGTEIVEIISRGEVYAEIPIGEMYLQQLSLGDTIPVFIEALDRTLAGRIEAIVPYGPGSSRTFPVKVLLKDRDNELKVGMSVTAYVETRSPAEGIVVPKDAVWIQTQGNSVWVFEPKVNTAAQTAPAAATASAAATLAQTASAEAVSAETGKVYKHPVDIIVHGVEEYLIEPKSGEGRDRVAAGAQVVIEGLERLAMGQEVRVVSINPEFLENLPQAFGHATLAPKPRKDLLVQEILAEARKQKREQQGQGTETNPRDHLPR